MKILKYNKHIHQELGTKRIDYVVKRPTWSNKFLNTKSKCKNAVRTCVATEFVRES